MLGQNDLFAVHWQSPYKHARIQRTAMVSPILVQSSFTSLKILGVTFTDKLSVSVHVDDVISSCAVHVRHQRLAVSWDVGVCSATGVPRGRHFEAHLVGVYHIH